MVLSKTVLLLFGLVLCAVLIALLTRNYNDALCARISDLVKIKKGGGKYLKTRTGRKLYRANPEKYRLSSKKYKGGIDPEPDINALSVQGYNKGFKREFEEDKPSFQNITLEQMADTRFPPERTF